MKIIDLTHTITEAMTVYPDTEPPRFEETSSYLTSGFRETRLTFFSHTGTHMDAPAHIFPDGTALDTFPLQQFAGKALVIEAGDRKEGEEITMEILKPYGEKAEKADFLLFHLGWDQHWNSPAYFGNYPCLSREVIDFILTTEKKGVGFDAIGADPVNAEDLAIHKALLKENNVVIIENLTRLEQCGNELFWFFALPLKWRNADGAPIRAVAFWEE